MITNRESRQGGELGVRRLRLYLIHLLLIAVLVNFTNCGGGFDSGTDSLSGIGGSEDQSSTGTDSEEPSDSEEPKEGEDVLEPEAPVITSLRVQGSEYFISWSGETETAYGLIIDDRNTQSEHRTTSQSISVSGLAPGRHCFKVYSRYPSLNKWPTSSELCETLPDNNDTAPTRPPVVDVEDLRGQVYVVDSVNGSDSNDGLSVATAWRTIDKVNRSVSQSGSDVCLMAGSVWTERLDIDWGGTSANYARVLGCYVDRGDGHKLLEYDTGTGNGRGPRPILGNETTPDCIRNANCPAFDGKGFGSVGTPNFGQIEIMSSYVEVAGLSVQYTNAMGIRASTKRVKRLVSHGIIRDIKMQYVGKQSVTLIDAVENFVIRRVETHNDSQCHIQVRKKNNFEHGWCGGKDPSAWGASILVSRGVKYALVEDNDVSRVFGEGINAPYGPQYVIIRNNRVGNTHSTSIYMGCVNCVIENNIVWGAYNYTGDYTSNPFGGQFAVNIETQDSPSARNVFIRNNITVNSSAAGAKATTFPETNGPTTEAFIYGNTLLGVKGKGISLTRKVANFEVFSNILFFPDLSPSDQCSLRYPEMYGPGTPNMDYNLWAKSPQNGRCSGGNDLLGSPQIASGSSEWDRMDWRNIPTIEAFRPQAGSPVLGRGNPELDDLKCFNASEYGSFITSHMSTGFKPDLSRWEKCLYYDIEGKRRDPASPDMGALEF